MNEDLENPDLCTTGAVLCKLNCLANNTIHLFKKSLKATVNKHGHQSLGSSTYFNVLQHTRLMTMLNITQLQTQLNRGTENKVMA